MWSGIFYLNIQYTFHIKHQVTNVIALPSGRWCIELLIVAPSPMEWQPIILLLLAGFRLLQFYSSLTTSLIGERFALDSFQS